MDVKLIENMVTKYPEKLPPLYNKIYAKYGLTGVKVLSCISEEGTGTVYIQKNPFSDVFTEALKKDEDVKGMSVKEAAERLGLSKTTIRNIRKKIAKGDGE